MRMGAPARTGVAYGDDAIASLVSRKARATPTFMNESGVAPEHRKEKYKPLRCRLSTGLFTEEFMPRSR